MSGRVLFDKDVLIDASREADEAVDALEEAEKRSSLAISSVTQMELIVGCENKSELRTVEKFLERFPSYRWMKGSRNVRSSCFVSIA